MTGMPAASARLVGAMKAFPSMTGTPMPSTLALMAAFIALTISLTIEFTDPTHWYLQLNKSQASWAPYRVGTKNSLVVTWLTNVNVHVGCDGNGFPAAL